VLEALRDGTFLPDDRAASREIWQYLMERGDPYLHLADFRPFLTAQAQATALFADRSAWAAAAIRNIAAMGAFSSDRAVREYADLVWGLAPVPPQP
jgi:starch phosphorylase